MRNDKHNILADHIKLLLLFAATPDNVKVASQLSKYNQIWSYYYSTIIE
jgi:hypothetical protein